jgi:hypothetical protein
MGAVLIGLANFIVIIQLSGVVWRLRRRVAALESEQRITLLRLRRVSQEIIP